MSIGDGVTLRQRSASQLSAHEARSTLGSSSNYALWISTHCAGGDHLRAHFPFGSIVNNSVIGFGWLCPLFIKLFHIIPQSHCAAGPKTIAYVRGCLCPRNRCLDSSLAIGRQCLRLVTAEPCRSTRERFVCTAMMLCWISDQLSREYVPRLSVYLFNQREFTNHKHLESVRRFSVCSRRRCSTRIACVVYVIRST